MGKKTLDLKKELDLISDEFFRNVISCDVERAERILNEVKEASKKGIPLEYMLSFKLDKNNPQ